MADVDTPSAWTDSNSASPPNDNVNPTPPQYHCTVITGIFSSFPFTFGGGSQYLAGVIAIPWAYTLGSNGQDPGFYINVSLNGGVTWVSTQIRAAAQGNGSGTFNINLAGATGLLVDFSTVAHP